MKSLVYIFIALLLAVNNVFINFKVGPISYDRILEFAFFFLFINTFLEEIKYNRYFRIYNLFVLVLATLKLFMNLKLVAFDNVDSEIILKSLIKCFSFVAYSFLFLLIVKENIKYLNIIIAVHIGICIFAILQHPLSPLSGQVHQIKMFLFSNVEAEEGIAKRLSDQELYIDLNISNKFRLSGPFASSITLAYFLLSSLFLNIYMYFRTTKRIYIFTILFIILCSSLTQTRSLVIAEALIFLGIFIFINNEKFNSYKIILTISLLVASLFFINKIESALTAGDTTRLANLNDSGSRPLLWLTGIYAIANHPFGISDVQYQKIREDMYNQFNNESLLYNPSHNGFINVGFNYTFIGYFVMFFFFKFIYRYIKQLSFSYKVLFTLFFLAYVLNSFFHNNFIFYTDYDVYMVLMLIPIHQFFENEKNKNLVSDVTK